MKDISGFLRSTDMNERKQAIVLLTKKPCREHLAICQQMADNDAHVEVRFLAKRAVNLLQAVLNPAAAKAVPSSGINEQKLKSYLSGTEKEKLGVIQHILANNLKQTLPLIIEHLASESNPSALSSMILAVGRLGASQDGQRLIGFLEHQNPRIRASAVEAMGMLGTTAAYQHVLNLLEDPDNRVRGNAVIAIRNLGPADTGKVIREMADSDLSSMKATAAYVLRFFVEEQHLPTLLKLLSSNDISVRNTALKTLETFRDRNIGNAKELFGALGDGSQFKKDVLPPLEPLPAKEATVPAPTPREVKAAPEPASGVVSAPAGLSAVATDRLPENYVGSSGRGALALHLKTFGQQTPPDPTPECSLDQILVWGRSIQASDLHISPGKPVMYRQFGVLKTLPTPAFTVEQTMSLLEYGGIERDQYEWFRQHGDLETVIIISGAGRFRVTLMKHLGGVNITARIIPWAIRSFEDSGMPPSCKGLINWAQGLVLVTGPAGCGKTSALATFVEMINQERHDHIITIEKPIEIVYEPARCQISQREVGCHTLSQQNALKGALREDPDILVVSELRDLDSIQLAISAAETGHLVFGTMNTVSAGRTVSRITDSFAPEEQAMLQNMLSESLRGIVCMQLIPRKDGTGVVPAYEVLIVTTAVSNMIRKEGLHQLASVMTMGKNAGMVTMDQSLRTLVEKGIISGEEAYYRADSKRDFAKFLPKSQ